MQVLDLGHNCFIADLVAWREGEQSPECSGMSSSGTFERMYWKKSILSNAEVSISSLFVTFANCINYLVLQQKVHIFDQIINCWKFLRVDWESRTKQNKEAVVLRFYLLL